MPPLILRSLATRGPPYFKLVKRRSFGVTLMVSVDGGSIQGKHVTVISVVSGYVAVQANSDIQVPVVLYCTLLFFLALFTGLSAS